MIAQIFLPQIKRQVGKKFNVKPEDIKVITFFVNKVEKKITLTCWDAYEGHQTTISESEISMASDAVEKAVKSKIKGELFAYELEIVGKEFNATIYCSNEKGEKIALPIKNIF